MPKAIKKRVKKPAPAVSEKNLIDETKKFIEAKKRPLMVSAAAVVLALLVVTGYPMYKKSIENRAAGFEYEGYRYLNNLYIKGPLPEKERFEKAAEGFRKAYETKKTPYALLNMANSHYLAGNYEEAMKAIDELSLRFRKSRDIMPIALYKKAMIYASRGEAEEGLKTLDGLYKSDFDFFRDLALVESARMLEALGRAEEAKAKYEALLKEFPDSAFNEEAVSKTGGKEKPEEKG